MAKYPFLNEASEHIRQTRFEIDEFNRPEMQHIIECASERVETEISLGKVYEKLNEKFEVEILVFLVTLILVRYLGTEPILKKYSLFESMRAEKFLVQDLRELRGLQEKKRLLLFKIFEELFSIKVENDLEDTLLFKVKVTDYLARASHFNEQEWKLVNRVVHKGHVYLDPDETVRLIRAELSSLIYERVKHMPLLPIAGALKLKAENLKSKLVAYHQYRVYSVTDYPPCVKHAIEVMNKGENLPHSARVMLATYMLGIGKPIDEIIELFQNAPDYNERVTRYQVEHLAGLKGSRIKYSVPSCEKLRADNLCFATVECNGLINPIQFGRRLRSNDGSKAQQ